ncbi:MAG: hypothetical protein MUF38_16500 [Anaerolineae bacterium]|nr:hypothetical protein [Anaerolineae bacterium]
MRWLVLAVLAVLVNLTPAAQETDGTPRTVYHVLRDNRGGALAFIDPVTGEEQRVLASGERFTIVRGGVIWWDSDAGQVMWAGMDTLDASAHPFIQLRPGDSRVDWAVSDGGRRILWTLVRDDAPGIITTQTWTATVDGADRRLILEETRTDGLRVKPVAFSPDGQNAVMDYQPGGLESLLIFPQFAGLFTIDTTAETPEAAFLPGEPGDFTGAGVKDGRVVRLTVAGELGGFDVRVLDLALGRALTIDALRLSGYTLAGDVLVSPDGERAVYTLATITGTVGAARVESVLVSVDVSGLTQTALTTPQPRLLRPVGWTDGGEAILLIDPAEDGTWKVRLDSGRVEPVANLTWVGKVEN